MSAIDLKAEGFPITMRASHLCAVLGISLPTLYKRIKIGHVPAYRRIANVRGALYEWHRPDVETWLTQRTSLRLHRRA